MSRPNPGYLARLQKRCDEWNAKYPVGRQVMVTMDSGEIKLTRTRSQAQVPSGHTAVIWLEGISGAYLLSRVQAVTA